MITQPVRQRSLLLALALFATLFSTTGCAHSGYGHHDAPVYRDYGYRSSPHVEMSVIWPAVVAPAPRVYYTPAPVWHIDRSHRPHHRHDSHDGHRGHRGHGHHGGKHRGDH